MAGALLPGDPAPLFTAKSLTNPRFIFDSVAGRYILLGFFGSTAEPVAAAALRDVAAHRNLFDDDKVVCFGVAIGAEDATRMQETMPGLRCFLDFDGSISRLYGALGDEAELASAAYRPLWVLLDPTLRILATAPIADSESVLRLVAVLPPVPLHAGTVVTAPILIMPRIFEPGFCRRLIRLYEAHGGEESGFMRQIEGKTVGLLDHSFKRRSDYVIEDETICAGARARISRRLVPEIRKAFQFWPKRIERFIVACYDARDGGFFRPHRDNTTLGTAHRKFAVTINLNAEEYEGGDLRFPEFGPQTYRAPTGGAVVFSCSLLHEATLVTKGRRFAFLPFLYDDEAAKQREANAQFIVDASREKSAARQDASLPSAEAE